jgi:hypothetical protein
MLLYWCRCSLLLLLAAAGDQAAVFSAVTCCCGGQPAMLLPDDQLLHDWMPWMLTLQACMYKLQTNDFKVLLSNITHLQLKVQTPGA